MKATEKEAFLRQLRRVSPYKLTLVTVPDSMKDRDLIQTVKRSRRSNSDIWLVASTRSSRSKSRPISKLR